MIRELPRCRAAGVLTEDDQFLLRLEVAETGQAVFVPLPYEAAAALADVARYVVENFPAQHQGKRH